MARRFGLSWLDLCNRSEQLRIDRESGGRTCAWDDSSTLSVARIFPGVGSRLLGHVLASWPVRFDTSPAGPEATNPAVSILIPIGGTARLRQFELALAAARAQAGVEVEVIVVEQGSEAKLAGRLPAEVRYVHQPAAPGLPFNKSRALNEGARLARGDVLVILDGDYLLPERFAREAFDALRGAEAARPARLLFYLDEASSCRLDAAAGLPGRPGIERIVANNPTPVVVRRSTYWDIGGHDEAYFGWGGEDSEFLDRLRTRRLSEGGWMPVLHVWHAPAPKKESGDRNRELHERTMAVPAVERIGRLRAALQSATSAATGTSR
jgi:hypothetical protein